MVLAAGVCVAQEEDLSDDFLKGKGDFETWNSFSRTAPNAKQYFQAAVKGWQLTYTDDSKSSIKKLELIDTNGKKLNMKKKYRVVTNNYVASIADSPREDQGERGAMTTSDLIMQWLEKKGTVDYQGRSSFTEKY